EKRPKHELPERPVPPELCVAGTHGLCELTAEENQTSGTVDDRLVRHEPFFLERRKAWNEARTLLIRRDSAPGDLKGHPDRFAARPAAPPPPPPTPPPPPPPPHPPPPPAPP